MCDQLKKTHLICLAYKSILHFLLSLKLLHPFISPTSVCFPSTTVFYSCIVLQPLFSSPISLFFSFIPSPSCFFSFFLPFCNSFDSSIPLLPSLPLPPVVCLESISSVGDAPCGGWNRASALSLAAPWPTALSVHQPARRRRREPYHVK